MFAQASALFTAHREVPALAGWAGHGLAFVALRQRDYLACHRRLDEASAAAGPDPVLGAVVDHLRGSALFHQGEQEQARQLLLRALAALGSEHALAGRVLDTLGMVYAARNNLLAAEAFYRQALVAKERWDDVGGCALSHGQLGRLYLGWGDLDRAAHHLHADLSLAEQLGDSWGANKVRNHLGQVGLARGASAQAAALLDGVIAVATENGWALDAAYAKKDRAAAAVALGDEAGAAQWLDEAEVAFRERGFPEGGGHVAAVEGSLRRRQGRYAESVDAFGRAAAWFEARGERSEAARVRLALARVCREAGEPISVVAAVLFVALGHAEACRHPLLVAEVGAELQATDPAAYWHRAWQRGSARTASDAPGSLVSGLSEMATVLYLDLQGSTQYARGRDPGEVLATLNQMMAEMAEVLRGFEVTVYGFRGDGFLAVARGEGGPLRAVRAGLGLFEALTAFNEPRHILGLPVFVVRIGIATGPLFFGNVGTYDRIDFSCVGTAANLGARLESRAEAGVPLHLCGDLRGRRARVPLHRGEPAA